MKLVCLSNEVLLVRKGFYTFKKVRHFVCLFFKISFWLKENIQRIALNAPRCEVTIADCRSAKTRKGKVVKNIFCHFFAFQRIRGSERGKMRYRSPPSSFWRKQSRKCATMTWRRNFLFFFLASLLRLRERWQGGADFWSRQRDGSERELKSRKKKWKEFKKTVVRVSSRDGEAPKTQLHLFEVKKRAQSRIGQINAKRLLPLSVRQDVASLSLFSRGSSGLCKCSPNIFPRSIPPS